MSPALIMKQVHCDKKPEAFKPNVPGNIRGGRVFQCQPRRGLKKDYYGVRFPSTPPVLTKQTDDLPWMRPWILDVDASGISTKPDITIKPEAVNCIVPGVMN